MAQAQPRKTEGATFKEIALDLLDDSPFQMRDCFETADLEASIRSNGFAGAILVRPKNSRYEIVYGHRRRQACALLKRETIPCIVKDLSDAQAHEISLVENLQRKDLDPFEEADGLHRLKTAYNYSLNDLAGKLSKKRSTIAAALKLRETPPVARKAFAASRANPLGYQFTKTHCELIARLPVEGDREKLARSSISNQWSTRTLADQIDRFYMIALDKAKFDLSDDTLSRPACVTCPKNTSNNRDLFSSSARGAVCTDPGCYRVKTEQHVIRLARQKEQDVIPASKGRELLDHTGKHIDYRHGDNYVALNDEPWQDFRGRSFSQLLRNSKIKPVVILHPSGNAVEAVSSRAAWDWITKTHGITKNSSHMDKRKPTGSDLQRRDEKKAKRQAWHDVAAIVAASAHALKPLPMEHWPIVWRQLSDFTYAVAIDAAVKRRAIELKKQGAGYDKLEQIIEVASGWSPRRQASLFYEIQWLHNARDWVDYNQPHLRGLARHIVEMFTIDVEAIVKKHLGAIRERALKREEAKKQKEAKDGSRTQSRRRSCFRKHSGRGVVQE